jgi:hypothetical protein
MPQCRLTNVDDVTLDHAILRANCTIGKTVFSGTAVELDSNDVRKCFFGPMGGSGPAISLSSDHELPRVAHALEQRFAAEPLLARPRPDFDALAATTSSCRTLGRTAPFAT